MGAGAAVIPAMSAYSSLDLEKEEGLEGQDTTLMYSLKKCRNTVSVKWVRL